MENGLLFRFEHVNCLRTWKRIFNKQTYTHMQTHKNKYKIDEWVEWKKSPMIIIAWFDLWLECVRKDQFFDQYYDWSIYCAGESWMTWTWQYIWKMTLKREKNALSLYVDSVAIFDSFQFFFFHRPFPGSQFSIFSLFLSFYFMFVVRIFKHGSNMQNSYVFFRLTICVSLLSLYCKSKAFGHTTFSCFAHSMLSIFILIYTCAHHRYYHSRVVFVFVFFILKFAIFKL